MRSKLLMLFYIYYQMGICETSTDKNIVYTTKSLLDKAPGTKNTHFYFSTEPLSKLDGDCLLLLTEQHSIKNNIFIKNMQNRANANQICKQFRSASNGLKPPQGQLLIYNTSIPGLEFQKIAVVCLPQQKFQQSQSERSSTKGANIKQQLKKCVQQIIDEGSTSLVVTELQWKSWMNKTNLFKLLSQIIIEAEAFRSVVFACLSEDTQSLFMKTVQDLRDGQQQ